MSQTESQPKHYLAPRQGRFAVLLFVSFVFHMLAFVLSSEQNLQHQENVTIRALSARIANDVKMPLSANDRVSLAVIAEGYQADPMLAYVAIYNAVGELIVPSGNENTPTPAQTLTIEGQSGNVGKVVLKATPIERGQIVTNNWGFILASMFLHGLVWLLYAHLARPSKSLVQEIQNDASKTTLERVKNTPVAVMESQQSLYSEPTGDGYDDFVKRTRTSTEPATPPPPPLEVAELKESILNDANNALIVRFVYEDSQLLDLLVAEQAETYLAFCNQLLDKTLRHLFKNPNLNDVGHDVLAYFDKSGAIVKLQSPVHARCVMAGAMLTRTFAMVSQVTYKKHRENNQFALPIKSIATDGSRFERADAVVNRRYEPSLVLLDEAGIKEVSRYMVCEPVEVMSADDQDCYVLKDESTPVMVRTLEALRKSILTVG